MAGGGLHVGGVRTAIFNWAYARKNGGKFYLRIDDTDQDRHVEVAVRQIFEDFKWLGIDYDLPSGGLLYQSKRQALYLNMARFLLEKGLAYRCYCTKEDLDAERKAAGNTPYQYSGKCRKIPDMDRLNHITQSSKYCIRIDVNKVMQQSVDFDQSKLHYSLINDGNSPKLQFVDMCLGRITRELKEIGDFVIVRDDGSALYNFATVVDEIELKVTHVIRAQEHLTNTFPQLVLYTALQSAAPTFSHIPYICAPGNKNKKKLSKRDAATLGIPVIVKEYMDDGYIPDAIFNYLSHLGWGFDGFKEKWTRDEFVAKFDLRDVLKHAASMDPDKLFWLQSEYMKDLSLEQKVEGCRNWIPFRKPVEDVVPAIIKAAGDRFKKFSDIVGYLHFLDDSFFKVDMDAYAKRFTPETLPIVEKYLVDLSAKTDMQWTADELEIFTHGFCDGSFKSSDLIAALRIATTGKSVGFGLYDGMVILGRERTQMRLFDAIKGNDSFKITT
jgi:glutamyl-tRNA synthetase